MAIYEIRNYLRVCHFGGAYEAFSGIDSIIPTAYDHLQLLSLMVTVGLGAAFFPSLRAARPAFSPHREQSQQWRCVVKMNF